MLYRILAVLFLAGTAASVTAQSTLSFETYGDTYKSDTGPQVAGDFNNDGKPDLIQCCNSNTQMIFRAGNGPGEGYFYLTVWLGNGNGTFQTPQTYTTTQSPQEACIKRKRR